MKTEYTIYGTQGCYYCEQAKKLLDSYDLPYSYMDAPSSLFFQERFIANGIRKVPQIFVTDEGPTDKDERYIGGFEDLLKELSSVKR